MEKYIIAAEPNSQQTGIEYHYNSTIEVSSQEEAIKIAKDLFGDRILSFNKVYDSKDATECINNPEYKLSNFSWDEIKSIVKNGKYLFKYGDSKYIELSNGEIHEAVLVHYENRRAIFQFKDALSEEYPMNDECTNKGGWKKSKMANEIMPMIFNMLPKDLQSEIEQINIDGIDCHLFLPSEKEIFGKRIRGIDDDSKQFEYYKDIRNIHKIIKSDSVTGYCDAWCWTRTPYSGDTYGFMLWLGSSYNGNYASNNYAVAPCFAI